MNLVNIVGIITACSILTLTYSGGIKLATNSDISLKSWRFWTGMTIAYLPAVAIFAYGITR